MRLTLIILTLMLTMANALAVAEDGVDLTPDEHHLADVHQEVSSKHANHPEGLFAPHCCHTHVHVFILPQLFAPSVEFQATPWAALGFPSPRLIGYAPPVPPPKA